MNPGWFWATGSVACVIGANLALKAAANRIEQASAALAEPMLLAGVGLYVIGLLTWIAALRRLELSQVYPLMGVAIVVVVVLGSRVFDEMLTPMRLLGALLIAIGIVCVVVSPSQFR